MEPEQWSFVMANPQTSRRKWRIRVAVFSSASVFAVATFLAARPLVFAQSNPEGSAVSGCTGDNGGLALSPGFCATVFADNLGHIRHMAVAPDGVLYVNTWSGRYFHNDTPPLGGR
jgi:hypothetical protein